MMIKNYSNKNHRGNELLKNLGNATLAKSIITKDQLDNRFAYPSPTLVDGSVASLSLTIDVNLAVKIGLVTFIELVIAYPSTISTANAKVSGLPYSANGKFSGVIYEGVNTVHSYDALIDNDGVIQIFLNGVAVQNVALSTKTLILKLGYVAQ